MARVESRSKGDNVSSLDELELDELLSEQRYHDDDGFTARVMTSLPVPRTRLRHGILGGACVAGLGVALAFLPARELLSSGLLALNAGALSLSGVIAISCTFAAAVWAANVA